MKLWKGGPPSRSWAVRSPSRIELTGFKKAKSERADIKEGGKKVERMLKDANKMLRVSNASVDWPRTSTSSTTSWWGLAGVITVH